MPSSAVDTENKLELNSQQLKTWIHHKNTIRIENEKYLRQHPEARDILRYMVGKTMQEKPRDIQDFLVKIMTESSMPSKVQEFKKELYQLQSDANYLETDPHPK